MNLYSVVAFCIIQPIVLHAFENPAATVDEDAVSNLDQHIRLSQKTAKGEDAKLIPMRASPELVLAVAKKSAGFQAATPDEDERANILRSGDYWNGAWKEDVDSETILRTVQTTDRTPEVIKVKVMPGSKLYHLVSVLQRMSPKLLYIINTTDK